ncbi:hypothetical protein O6H91_17G080200 [Diphasiastrum complanatum]|uniref:Uncharacterized protein n=1 Tax=Diphasiastrum complanatum TaxID=34168 RepID=A0ACC2B8I4_DIPCM|nr:hypothetical protein O6H91_17G080200 [Diphasiastrum complanatum]
MHSLPLSMAIYLPTALSLPMSFCVDRALVTASLSPSVSCQYSGPGCCIIAFRGHAIYNTGVPRTQRRWGLKSGIRAAQQAFFESSIVQAESDSLRVDYSALLKLGRKYGKFDREGKVSYVEEMKKLVERWQIFVKRMELVDDFSAKCAVNKLRTEVGPLGLSNLDLADSMYIVLDEMKKDAEAQVIVSA